MDQNMSPGKTPKVTVLMPVYNGEKYLGEAIDSILGQTFRDFELLIIDDGSTDRSADIIRSYDDPRIRVVHHERNLGLIDTLNYGLDHALGFYIVRMDADDVSLPERLAKQVAYMEAHPEVGVCGTQAMVIDDSGRVVDVMKAPTGSDIEHRFWFPSPIIHPTCIFRQSSLGCERYDVRYHNAEDYEFFLRLFRKTVLENLAEPLLCYRRHSQSVTFQQRECQLETSYRAFSEHVAKELIPYRGFKALIFAETSVNPALRAYFSWLVSIKTGFHIFGFLCDNLRYLKHWIVPDSRKRAA